MNKKEELTELLEKLRLNAAAILGINQSDVSWEIASTPGDLAVSIRCMAVLWNNGAWKAVVSLTALQTASDAPNIQRRVLATLSELTRRFKLEVEIAHALGIFHPELAPLGVVLHEH